MTKPTSTDPRIESLRILQRNAVEILERLEKELGELPGRGDLDPTGKTGRRRMRERTDLVLAICAVSRIQLEEEAR